MLRILGPGLRSAATGVLPARPVRVLAGAGSLCADLPDIFLTAAGHCGPGSERSGARNHLALPVM